MSTIRTDTNNKLIKLKGLSFLRFIAAFWIFLFHYDMRLNPHLPIFLKNILTNGPIAMSFFFMLSGFVLTYRYTSDYKGFIPFYVARIARIYPAYLFCVLLSLPMLVYIDNLRNTNTIFSILFLFLLTVILFQAWYPNLFGIWHFAGTWAISVEMFLYALYPLTRNVERLSNKLLWSILTPP